MKILLAVDGSDHSLAAVKCVIEHSGWLREAPRIVLVTVHRPVPRMGRLAAVISRSDVERYYEEEGAKTLAAATRLLEQVGGVFETRTLIGEPAEIIAEHARKNGFDLICIGAPANWLGTTANKVVRLSDVPVLLVK